jgi:hypothetical protein
MQHHISDDADGPNSGLTVATSVIDLLDGGDRQTAERRVRRVIRDLFRSVCSWRDPIQNPWIIVSSAMWGVCQRRTTCYFHNYAGGTGLMSGAVFGRIAGRDAAGFAQSFVDRGIAWISIL